MKKLSIKAKITLWYTALVTLLIFFVLLFLFTSAEQVITSNARGTLEKITLRMADEIDVEDGEIEIDEDFKTYEKGVTILAFYKEKSIAGQYPTHFPTDTKIQDGQVFTIDNGSEKWLVYDIKIEKNLTVRGIYSLNEIDGSMSQMMVIALIAFPFMILIAALGGYFITKKAFIPVLRMANTANEIGNGDDLSKRINLPDTGDEISSLSKTFDSMLDRLSKSFDNEKQFASDVSHELRTPIAVLKSQCEYALTQENNEVTQKALKDILKKTDQMATLVAQLLELSRGEHEVNHLHFERVNISELLDMVVEEMTIEAEKKSMTIVVNPMDTIELVCEHTLMMRLMINLISNAIKYTEAYGKISISLEKREGTIIFSVCDTGIGIEVEHLHKIFNRFYKVNESRTQENENSFGLGLSFCKWIVSIHGGTIEVQSEYKKGSTFTVTLPYEL